VLSAQLKINDIGAASFAAAQSIMNAHLVVLVFENSPVDQMAILLTSTNLQVSIPPLIR
jgi:hypothetical protein